MLFKATTDYTRACTDAGAALAPLLSGGTRVRHCRQSTWRLWLDTRRLPLPSDDCYRLVFHTMPYSMQQTEQISNDPPRIGAKSTTTSNHPSTPGKLCKIICRWSLDQMRKNSVLTGLNFSLDSVTQVDTLNKQCFSFSRDSLDDRDMKLWLSKMVVYIETGDYSAEWCSV